MPRLIEKLLTDWARASVMATYAVRLQKSPEKDFPVLLYRGNSTGIANEKYDRDQQQAKR